MVLDGHIHIWEHRVEAEALRTALDRAGVAGGILFSLPPRDFFRNKPAYVNSERLANVLEWTRALPSCYPFYWINPVEPDAGDQVERAADGGIAGFKIICDRFYPGDARAMKVYARMAALGKPVLFHSGILWDGKPSSRYNRPVEFEALMDIAGLRFAMAHIAWPWCDEMIAVYGKLQFADHAAAASPCELFIDTTPGTPRLYRQEALTRLFRTGYKVGRNVFFGVDNGANDYDVERAAEWIRHDRGILSELGLSSDEQESVFSRNLERFIKG